MTTRYIYPRNDVMVVLAHKTADLKFIGFQVLLRPGIPVLDKPSKVRKLRVDLVPDSGDKTGHHRWKLHHKIPVQQDPKKWLLANGFGFMEVNITPDEESRGGVVLVEGLNFHPIASDADYFEHYDKAKLASVKESMQKDFPGRALPSDHFIMDALLEVGIKVANGKIAEEKKHYLAEKAKKTAG